MIYCFDIDGTLCTNTEGEYELAEPFSDVIARVNGLYEDGHRILLYTARGSTTGIDWREATERQLASWGAKYHELFFGKPTADLYIDDKAVNFLDWQVEVIEKERNNTAVQKADSESVFRMESYLGVTYSPERAPKGDYPHRLAEWLLKRVYQKPGRILDMGCGRGDFLAAFEELGFDVAGIEISPQAKELNMRFQVEQGDLELEKSKFPPGSFDYVFSKSVIEHMRNPIGLFTNAIEVLRPGGIAVIMTPSWEHTHWGPFYIDHTHVTPFTSRSLEDAMAIAGFDSIKVEYFYQLPILWRWPLIRPIIWIISALPIGYRPYKKAIWPEQMNKFIRFSKEVMLLGVGKRPVDAETKEKMG
jgi:SAM-dependent methyltransferase